MSPNGTFDVTNQDRSITVSSVAVMNQTRAVARDLEQREMRRGYKLPDARARVAARIGAAPGTLRSLALGRLKRFDAALRERIHALLMREIEQEIGRLSHELDIYRQTGLRLDSRAVTEAETLIATYKKIAEDA